jgi:hypothetical protein
MAQLTEETIRRLDHLLFVSKSQWEWLAEVEARFEDWDPDDQEAFVLEWAIEEERLEDLEECHRRGAMTEEQAARYEELKKLVSRNRPIIERLADR